MLSAARAASRRRRDSSASRAELRAPAPHDAGRGAAAAEPGADARARPSCASGRSELARLNRELEDTNRGVVALYAELDEQADHLRRADEMKSRFLSNMSHEFRTPLNSIRALARTAARPHRRGARPPSRRSRSASSARRPTTCRTLVERPARPGARSKPARLEIHAGRVRGRRPVQRAARHAAAAAGRRRRSTSCSRLPRGFADALHRRSARCRRSCATSSPTRSSSPSPARCA